VDLEPANAGARAKLDTQCQVLGPVSAIDGPLGALDAAPHAGRSLSTRAERFVGTSSNGIGSRPPVPAEPVVRPGYAPPNGSQRRRRQRRSLTRRKCRIACQPGNAEVGLDLLVIGFEIFVG